MTDFDAESREAEDREQRGLLLRIGLWQGGLFLIYALVLLKAVPSFEKIFRDFDTALPGPTVLVLQASNWFRTLWFLAVPMWIGVMAALVMLCLTGCGPLARRFNTALIAIGVVGLGFIAVTMFLPLCTLFHNLS